MEFDILFNVRHKSELLINMKEEKLDLQVASISSVVFLIAALIFSAGYYSALIFFYFVEQKMFRFCRFFNILREIFLTSLG